MSALFDFDLLLAQADREGYYHTRWDQATPVTAQAATKQEAINAAAKALGDPQRGRYWVARVKKVAPAAVTVEDERDRIASAIESLHYDAPAARIAQATAARIARGGAL